MRYARVKFVPGNRVHEKRVLTSAIIDLVEQGQDLGFGLGRQTGRIDLVDVYRIADDNNAHHAH